MSLLTNTQRAQLHANGRTNAARNAAGQDALDFIPVVKLFTSDANATWLLTELDPGDDDREHAKPWGSLRYCCNRLIGVRAARAELPPAEGISAHVA